MKINCNCMKNKINTNKKLHNMIKTITLTKIIFLIINYLICLKVKILINKIRM